MARKHTPKPNSSAIQKRSCYLDEVKTSVSLEDPFWEGLMAIAVERGITRLELLRELKITYADEKNFSSQLRMFVLASLQQKLADATRHV